MTTSPIHALQEVVQSAYSQALRDGQSKGSSGKTGTHGDHAVPSTLLKISGGQSKDFYGLKTQGASLSSRTLQGIISYEPSELFITASAGTPLTQIEAALAQNNQYLAFEAPNFNGSATVGGMVAAGLSGPARASSGAVRDFVLGLKMLNGRGELLSFGGQVIKNVAGYDLSRVMCGSWGMLGMITEVSLKVLPIPAADITLRLQLEQQEALDLLNRWMLSAVPINASVWQTEKSVNTETHKGRLWVRLRGAKAAVQAGLRVVQQTGSEKKAEVETIDLSTGSAFWGGIRHQSDTFFTMPIAADACLWRLSVPQKITAKTLMQLSKDSPITVEWNGALRWFWASAKRAEVIHHMAKEYGGHATLWRVSSEAGEHDKVAGVFTPLDATQRRIQQALQREFDPCGIFRTGRLAI
jgi:glycolate oxidase FAD binding subunit